MEGHALTSGTDWSRLFFMAFYVFTMIVMTIIVAFILEAFLFRIQYKNLMNKHDGRFCNVLVLQFGCNKQQFQSKRSWRRRSC